MALNRYEPWGVVSQLQSDINRLFGNVSDGDSNSATADWSPAVDVHEYKDRFQLLFDLPGIDPQHVEITLDNSVLTVAGSRQPDEGIAKSEPAQHRLERHHGRFYRRFILPDTVDSEKVNASGRHGVLEIVIPKHAKSQPRRISVT